MGDTIRDVPASLPDPDLVARIAASTGLTEAESARVVEDVVAFHTETVEELHPNRRFFGGPGGDALLLVNRR